MKTLFAIVIFAVLAQVTIQARLRAKLANDFPEIKNIEKSKWGAQLLDTVALQLENKAPMDTINAVIDEIISGLKEQQSDEDEQHAAHMAWCASEDSRLNTIIGDAKFAIDTATSYIVSLKKSIRNNETKQTKLESQIATLESEISDTHNKREKDQADFTQRKGETESAVEAIEDAIDIVAQLVQEGPQDVSVAIEKLAKIGRSNPILAFAQVASTADQETVNKLLKLLNGLKVSMISSLEADAIDEDESAAAYDELLTNLGALLAQNQADLKSTLLELKNDRSSLVQWQTEKAAQITIAQNGQAELDGVTQECENADATYNDNKAGRAEELSIATEVKALLEEKFGKMSGYLSDRLTQNQ